MVSFTGRLHNNLTLARHKNLMVIQHDYRTKARLNNLTKTHKGIMSTPQEKLAESLEALRELQGRGVVAIRSDDLRRTDRERLLDNGFLKEVMKGWYIPSRPDEPAGDSTGVVRLVLGLLRRLPG